MAKPKLDIAVEPSQGGKVFYLPLAPKSASQPERLKIAVRLRITNKIRRRQPVTIVGISFSFPATSLGIWTMAREQEYIDPEGGVLAFDETATWSNGRVVMEDGSDWHNEVYLDAPAPPKIKVNVHCAGFSEPDSVTMDLIPWVDATGEGPVIIPFALSNLEWNEHVVTSAVHHFPGGANGGQLFAHDFSVQALVDGAWTRWHTDTEPRENSDNRIFGMPVRAIADGTVFDVVDQWDDNPVGEELEGPPKPPVGGNSVWVRHGNLEVKYAHLRRGSVIVGDGERVDAGQKIGEGGNSGNTGGMPHLHLEGRDTATNTLRGFVFKDAWMLERSQVPQGGTGPRVRLRAEGICQEDAAIRPFGRPGRPTARDITQELLETLVGQVFGGVSKGGDGFVIVGGKIIRVPPRGPKWALLQSLIALDAAEQIEHPAASRIVREIADTIANISKDVGTKKKKRHRSE